MFFRGSGRGPAISEGEVRAALAELRKAAAARDDWSKTLTSAESPLERERLILEKAARSASAYLQDRLNIVVERKSGGPSEI